MLVSEDEKSGKAFLDSLSQRSGIRCLFTMHLK